MKKDFYWFGLRRCLGPLSGPSDSIHTFHPSINDKDNDLVLYYII